MDDLEKWKKLADIADDPTKSHAEYRAAALEAGMASTAQEAYRRFTECGMRSVLEKWLQENNLTNAIESVTIKWR